MGAAGTVTLVFTDVVGSTRLLGELGDGAAEVVLRRHFGLLREQVERHGGREVKSLGDGLMLAFASATEAVECAVAMQRATAATDDGLGLRVGLHAGEPSLDGDDYFGTPVVVAQRLCARAEGGEILASGVVRGLIGRGAKHPFDALGELELKGLDEPVGAFAVRWDAEREPARAPVPDEQPPLPRALALRGTTTFVGRTDALSQLVGRFDESRVGRLRLVVVGGEPGIGKTRLAREFAAIAHDAGSTVMYGRADEDGVVPYQPFAEAIRGHLAAVPVAAAAARGLGHLLPELGGQGGSAGDPALQRYLLFEAVSGFLASVSRAGPVVLVLDDLHWADAPTLLLLRHLAREARSMPLLILATYRETDLSRRHPLAEALADLRRDNLLDRVPLRGLTSADVAELLRHSAGHEVPEAFARTLHEETEGNPFFLEEVLRHLVESGAIYERDGTWTSDVRVEQMGIPEGVREAVGRRLARLSETCNRALAAAAVLGRSWEFELLAEMVDASEDELLDALEEALAAQLVVEGDASGHAFTHALVRETLYEELSLPRRQRMHLRAAEAIERRHARDLDAQASTLALHLRLAGAAADAAKRLEWSLRAAAVTGAALAFEEATGHLESALEDMEELDTPPEQRARLLERTADLKYVAGFDLVGAVGHLEQALGAYETAGLHDRAARVHSRLARDRATFFGQTHDVPLAFEHIAAARVLLEREESGPALGFLLIAESTAEVWILEDLRRSQAAGEQAMEIAERCGHESLWSNAASLTANAMVARGELSAGGELIERAWQVADRVNNSWGAFLATWTLGGFGLWLHGPRDTLAAVERELSRPRIAGALGQKTFLGLFSGNARMQMGDVEAAEASISEAPPPHWGFDAMAIAQRGDGEQALRIYERTIEESRASGNRWSELAMTFRAAELRAARGDLEVGALDACAETSRAAEHLVFELNFRSLAGAWAGEQGRREEGLAHLERCREILASGENWATLAARVDWAAGALAQDEGDGCAHFERALAALERLEMELLRARVLHGQGVFLSERDPARAVGCFDRALGIYEDAGVGPAWTDRLRTERESSAALA